MGLREGGVPGVIPVYALSFYARCSTRQGIRCVVGEIEGAASPLVEGGLALR